MIYNRRNRYNNGFKRGGFTMKKISMIKVGIIIVSLMLVFHPLISAQKHDFSSSDFPEKYQENIEKDIRPLSVYKHILSSKSSSETSLLSLFTSTIHTLYEDVEKT